MPTLSRTLALLAACLAATAAHGQETVSLARADGQSVPAVAYAPAGPRCQGIAVVSPGAGGSEKGYGYLARAMSDQGYLAIVAGHVESGPRALHSRIREEGLREGLAELVADPQAYRARLMDVAAARAWAASRCPGGDAILLGHSMGAATALIEAGARNRLAVHGRDAFDAYVVLSPQGPGSVFPEQAWRGIAKPVLSITGTRDGGQDRTDWHARTLAFADMRPGCKWLAVIDGATHLNFAGLGLGQARVEEATVSVLRSFLLARGQDGCTPPDPPGRVEIRAK
ncbi:MAG: alpha/beta hydrolase [Alcaligenaceae bacterium]|nr:alpha/beta hydrolase [Alcaligenaceae bacterium SAGV5]MPS54019.1 alpha/beta hydrolase [Alcaligenaceae bacterium SAGV3]MPT58968.1 alpha/beta hydrolase [Alcaligenaceae bacterium]